MTPDPHAAPGLQIALSNGHLPDETRDEGLAAGGSAFLWNEDTLERLPLLIAEQISSTGCHESA